MDLTNFDTINDMLRSFSSEPSNIDMLLQQSGNLDSFMATLNNTSNPPPTTPTAPMNDHHPHFHKSLNDISPHHPPHSNNYYEDDIFTPLISPAMTPSFPYHPHQQQQHHQHPGPVSQEMDFSPLTSPAIMPQQHLHSNQYQHRHSRESSNSNMTVPVSMPPSSMPTSEDSNMTPSQIYEQYEQLERAKIMITRRLSELHKHQKRPREEEQIQQQKHIQQQQQYRISDQQQPLSPAGSPCIEPVTPASLMKIKSNNVTPPVAVIKPATPITPKASSPPAKKSRRIAAAVTTNNSSTEHASPRALKPLLISPTLRPGPTPSPLVHDAEHILATRSNYQNLMEGKAAALGIAFSSNIKSGLEIRRTAHKAAEQKRRDSLKEWFDRLRREVEEGYVKQKEKTERELLQQQQQQQEKPRQEHQPQSPTDQEQNGKDEEPKPLSKVLLLKYAYEYISSLKDIIEEKDQRIRQLERQQ
ncbi:hypothetical protein BDC45DRAFT_521322 [Circinella umbellata]|nr:hypothetical protein BDC45DRAFT_521322 [Circinella umbellata]